MCSAKTKTKQTQEEVHSRRKIKQQGDAREKFPSITHFSEKQWLHSTTSLEKNQNSLFNFTWTQILKVRRIAFKINKPFEINYAMFV